MTTPAVETVTVIFDTESLSAEYAGSVTISAENAAVDANGVTWMPDSVVYDLATATESEGLLPSDQSTPRVLYTIIIEGGNSAPVILTHVVLDGNEPITLSSLIAPAA